MLLGGLFLLFVIQVVGTHLQVKEYKRAVREMHKLGNVGIGARRRKLGPSNIVVIACNSTGVILDGRIMQGMTILSRFRPPCSPSSLRSLPRAGECRRPSR